MNFVQSIIHSEFFYNVFNHFKNLCTSTTNPIPKSKVVKGNTYSFLGFTTMQLPCLVEFYIMFYSAGIKVIPFNIALYLTPIALAYWIMCDGSRQNDGIHLNTYGFTLEENQLLISAFNNNFNINCTMHNHSSGYRIYINKNDLDKIRPLLVPHFVPSMLYKLGL